MGKLLDFAKILALVGVIDKFNILPTSHSIRHLEKQLVAGARKIGYLKYGNKDMDDYIYLTKHLHSYQRLYGGELTDPRESPSFENKTNYYSKN